MLPGKKSGPELAVIRALDLRIDRINNSNAVNNKLVKEHFTPRYRCRQREKCGVLI